MKNTKEPKIDTSLPILPIGAVATALNVHQRTLRIYDQEGILMPSRSEKNRRNYSLDDLEKAKLVLFLTRNLAINLSGVKIILTMLKENNIKPTEYINYINQTAKNAGINIETQEENLQKTAKRGRRPNNTTQE